MHAIEAMIIASTMHADIPCSVSSVLLAYNAAGASAIVDFKECTRQRFPLVCALEPNACIQLHITRSGTTLAPVRQLPVGVKGIVEKPDRRRQAQPFEPLQPTENPGVEREPAPAPIRVLNGILNVVPTSTWSYARIGSNGKLSPCNCLEARRSAEIATLANEYGRQRATSRAGPRIAATVQRFSGTVSGTTLIFAERNTDCGILTLLRDEALAPFSSMEISMLTFALDAGSDSLAAFRLQPSIQPKTEILGTRNAAHSPALRQEAFYVLDADMEILVAWSSEPERRVALAGTQEHNAGRLPPILENSVRKLTAGWTSGSIKQPGVARPVSFLVLRTYPMSGRAGEFVGVRIDRFQPPNSLSDVAIRFNFSPREVQVLSMLLDGDSLDQVANQLFITPSTVQDHINSLLTKSESRNRTQMVARVLGWAPTASISSAL